MVECVGPARAGGVTVGAAGGVATGVAGHGPAAGPAEIGSLGAGCEPVVDCEPTAGCELSAIVAVCDDWGIGYGGRLLVSNRADMRNFVRLTSGHAVVMGRKTLDGFPGGRPLKNRRNIVLTRDADFARTGVEVVHSVAEALAAVAGEELAWVIGGAEVYRQLLPYCTRAVVTRCACTRPADAFFPNLDADPAWELVDPGEPAAVAPGEGDEGVEYRFATYRQTNHLGSGPK